MNQQNRQEFFFRFFIFSYILKIFYVQFDIDYMSDMVLISIIKYSYYDFKIHHYCFKK